MQVSSASCSVALPFSVSDLRAPELKGTLIGEGGREEQDTPADESPGGVTTQRNRPHCFFSELDRIAKSETIFRFGQP